MGLHATACLPPLKVNVPSVCDTDDAFGAGLARTKLAEPLSEKLPVR